MYVYNPSNFSVNYANTCWRANDLGNHQWADHAENGYIRLSTGLIIQWVTNWGAFTEGSSRDIYFCTTFPSNCMNVVVSPCGSTTVSNDAGSLEVITRYTNRVNIRSNSQSQTQGATLIAIGC